MELEAKIKSVDKDNKKFTVTLDVSLEQIHLIERFRSDYTTVILNDQRTITARQKGFIFALCNEISNWSGELREEVPSIMKYHFLELGICDYFSVSDTNMTIANIYIEFLINFCLKHSVPTKKSLINYADDIYRYVYACIANRKSCISNKPADIHHIDAVGMGRDRAEIVQLGMRVLPLTRDEHTEIHKIGKVAFWEKWHFPVEFEGVFLNEELCRILKGNRND